MAKTKTENKPPTSGNSFSGAAALAGLLIILLPLIFSSKTIDPVLSIRLAALSVMLLLLVLVLFWLVIHKKITTSYLRSNLFAAFALYLCITSASLFYAINPVEVLFDLSKTFLALLLLIVSTGIFLAYQKPEIVVAKAAITNALLACTIGIVQYFHFIESEISGSQYFANLYSISGVMGHKNQFAISLFLLLPFSLYGVFSFKRLWFYLSMAAIVLIFINFSILQTRSVWVAFWFSVGIVGLLALIFRRKLQSREIGNRTKKQLLYSLGAAIIITSLVVIFQPKNAREVLRYKIVSMIKVNSQHNQGRLDSWTATLEMIKDKPLTGFGTGNWKIHIPAYYIQKHGDEFKNWHHPHNDYLLIMSEKGIPGLLTYLLIFFLVFRNGIETMRKNEQLQEKALYILLLATVAGYLIIAFVDFPYERVNHQVMLMIIISLIMAGYLRQSPPGQALPKRLNKALAVLILMLLAISQYYSAGLFKTQKEIKLMYEAIEKEDVAGALKHASSADTPLFSLDHNSNPVKMHKGTALLMLKRYDEALVLLNEALKEHPNHPNVLNNIATIYAIKGNYSEAIRFFERAFQLFPRNQLTIRSLSRAYFEAGRFEEAYRIILLHNTNPNNYNKQVEELRNQLENALDEK